MPDCTCGGLRIIGDVHGDAAALTEARAGHQNAIQIGDMGYGFGHDSGLNHAITFNGGVRFFRGNHDNPSRCLRHKKHLTSGWHGEGFFIVGGGMSIDYERRTAGLNWWPDEEHSARELQALVDEFDRWKPRLVLSHEGPHSITNQMFTPRWEFHSATAQALQAMFEAHQPDLWLFGHWHRDRELMQGNTLFACVGERKTRDIHLPTCPMFEQSATPTTRRIAARLSAIQES
jgi:hypothetical protein